MANLRILYNNIADTATISSTATAEGYPTSNLKTDLKGLVWRSPSTLSTTITLTWTSNQSVRAVFVPFCNLTTSATIRVVYKNSAGTAIFDSGTVSAVPYNLSTINTITGSSLYSYGGGSSVRVYSPTLHTTVRSIDITIVDGTNPSGYMELSRLLVGNYWSPVHNTEFGLEVGYKDASTHVRSDSGNLFTYIGSVSKYLNFTLGYMVDSDRNTFIELLRQYGKRKAFMVSIFPEDTDKEKEALYEIYGKLSDDGRITHPMYTKYVSSISIEEV